MPGGFGTVRFTAAAARLCICPVPTWLHGAACISHEVFPVVQQSRALMQLHTKGFSHASFGAEDLLHALLGVACHQGHAGC